MITQEMIERINFLAKKQKTEGLTPAEQAEQATLRRQYVDSIKENLRAQLDSIKTNQSQANNHPHGHNCTCGCHHQKHHQ